MNNKYQKGEFCKFLNCEEYPNLMKGDKSGCDLGCLAYSFHNWLDKNGYQIVKKTIDIEERFDRLEKHFVKILEIMGCAYSDTEVYANGAHLVFDVEDRTVFRGIHDELSEG